MADGAMIHGEAGKAGRFRDLALPHLDSVHTLARYLAKNRADAEDAVQECYLRAFRHFDSFRGDAIKPWLLAILRNVCRTAHGRNAGLVFTPDAGTDAAEIPATPVWSEDSETPERTMLRRDDDATVRRLIGELPTEFREVIVLREIDDLSYRDIATVVDAPIGTVMSRLARGRALLRGAWIAAEGGRESQ
jgi:RNA polymerase sigma-70 factor, ECF subfamily